MGERTADSVASGDRRCLCEGGGDAVEFHG